MTVAEVLVEARAGLSTGPPKTDAGRRTVALPPPLIPVLDEHLATFGQPGSDDLRLLRPEGRRAAKEQLLGQVGQSPPDRWHGGAAFPRLRHTANTLAAATGASTRELMHRMGHASSAAALRYQHATRDRDQAIAKALGDLVTRQIPDPTPIRSGTPVARKAPSD